MNSLFPTQCKLEKGILGGQLEDPTANIASPAVLRICASTDAENPLICGAYATNALVANRGNVSMTASIERADGTVEALKLKGPVDRGLFFDCVSAEGDIAAGDVVTFAFKFKGMPRLIRGDERVDFFDVNGIVTTAGEPGLGNIPFGVNPGSVATLTSMPPMMPSTFA